MLNKEEEFRLAACIDVAKADCRNNPDSGTFYITGKTALWLAEKLKETNDELKQIRGA